MQIFDLLTVNLKDNDLILLYAKHNLKILDIAKNKLNNTFYFCILSDIAPVAPVSTSLDTTLPVTSSKLV